MCSNGVAFCQRCMMRKTALSASAKNWIDKAADALGRTLERWHRTGQWGLDGPAIQELKDGVSLYEEVLLASSPNQMHDAAMTSLRWIQIQDAEKKDTA